MRFSSSGRAVVAAGAAIAIAAGCSSSTPAPQAYVFATLTPTTGGSCQGVGGVATLLSIGSMGNAGTNDPTRVPNGGLVHVSCSVTGSNPDFSVSLAAQSDSSISGGSLSITGSGIASGTGASNLSGTFVGVNLGAYTASDCVLTYSFNGVANAGAGVAPGRIWGNVSCKAATNGTSASTCNVSVDFVFENCSS